MNIKDEIENMSNYLEQVWCVSKEDSKGFLESILPVVEKDYKNSVWNISTEIHKLLDERKANLNKINPSYYLVDSFYNLGINASMAKDRLGEDDVQDFDKSFKKALKGSTNKDCFKTIKLRGWSKELTSDSLSDGYDIPTYNGLHFKSATEPTFSNAIDPLTLCYANEKHGYGFNKIIQSACMTHLIKVIEKENSKEFIEDFKKLIESVKEKYDNFDSHPVFEKELEKKLSSRIGKLIAKKIAEHPIYFVETKEDFDRILKSMVDTLSNNTEEKKRPKLNF